MHRRALLKAEKEDFQLRRSLPTMMSKSRAGHKIKWRLLASLASPTLFLLFGEGKGSVTPDYLVAGSYPVAAVIIEPGVRGYWQACISDFCNIHFLPY